MAKKPLPRARIALPNAKGVYVERDITDDNAETTILTHCPETGRDLTGYSPAKLAASLWPTLDARHLPSSEAGRRYQLLLNEQERQDELTTA